ncbi:hypothetical protein QYM36_015522 [Artemia franciscana]|uniref:Ig-like domain-containing protein n=1 Tax=Artemia franciscana TaxID=6661 RepID=A0AA88HCK7_ARTSF|nr:hypothetical protein QYM36_015522 [Artemia franciscana]
MQKLVYQIAITIEMPLKPKHLALSRPWPAATFYYFGLHVVFLVTYYGYAPKCKTDEVIKAAGSRGETTTLACEVDADPTDVHFWWTFTPVSNIVAEAILLPRSTFIISGLKSVLKYSPKNESDFGTIGCWASNNAGSQKEPCLYHLVTAGRPSPVKNCSASNISFDAFRVSCDASWDGGLLQTFELEVLDPWSRQVLQTLSSSTCWFEVKGENYVINGGCLQKNL